MPSYNQFPGLIDTIKNLSEIGENQGLLSDIEFIVSDNNSTDGSAEYLSQLDTAYNVYLQPKNRGFLENIDFLFAKSTGKYIIFFGCGETFNVKLFANFLKFLKSCEFDFVALTPGSCNTQNSNSEVNYSSGIFAPIYSESISLNVIRREAYKHVIHAAPIKGSAWPHVERLLMLKLQFFGKNRAIVRNPFVNFYDEKTGWAQSPDAYTLALAHLDLLTRVIVKKCLNPALLVKFLIVSFISVPRAILQAKKYGLRFSIKVLPKILWSQRFNPIGALISILCMSLCISKAQKNGAR